ncbi:MAG: DUF1559 domain-containing protein, partial [Planctomycetaceae bacterium]|nr:DUF1559 domain-containing protein [Planctomycetaceae bacterium]
MTTTAKEQDAAGMTDSALSLQKQIEQESVWSSAWSGFVEGLKNKQPLENQDTPLTWPAMIAFLFLAGLTAGFLRLCVGYILLKREVKHSTELDGTSARELLDGLLLEHSSVISLRESTRLATAAVVGWWHPVILLPETWRGWSTDQLRAVLTHELTHILQGDFLSNLCAEISRSVYFYHPLMHWLVARLRLEQELAADAAAAHSSGGTESYLVILAEMAMVQSNRRVRGPARAFLPTQSTFLRRIDMLKENTPYRGSVSRSTRWGIIAIVMSAGILAVGFRGNEVTIAQDTLQTTISANDTKTSPETLRIDLIPNNALAVLMVRPEQILNQDSFKPIRDLLKQLEDKNSKDSGILGFKPQEIETATIIFMAEEAPAFSVEVSGIVIQTNKEIDREAAISNLGVANQAAQYKGQTYLKNIVGSRSEMRLFLDKHTLIFTTREKDMQAMIDTMQQGGTRRWAKQWQSIRNASVAWVIDMRVARAIVGNKPTQLTAANAPVLGVISPIWENTNVVSLGLSVHQNLSINATLSQDQNGESVRDTLDAVLILARNMLSQMRQNISGDNVQERLALMSLMDTAAQAMKSIKVTQNGEDVAVAAMLPEDTVSQLVAIMVPAVMQAREAASRAHSLNNIKQIVLALYGYHDKYKHFPPAVLIGPDGKTPYSWRVALLPFLEQQALYDEYDRNEPWDSEHNKKVLAK